MLPQIIQRKSDLQALVKKAEKLPRIGYDVETANGARPERGACICGYAIGLGVKVSEGYYIPVRHNYGAQSGSLDFGPPDEYHNLDPVMVAKALKALLESKAIKKVGANLKFDLRHGRREGIELRGIIDIQQGARILLPNMPRVENERTRYGLKALRVHMLGVPSTERDELVEWLEGAGYKPWYEHVHRAPIGLTGQYGAVDCTAPLAIYKKLMKLVEEDAKYHKKKGRDPAMRGAGFLWGIENKLATALADIEDVGVPVDVPYFEALEKKLSDRQREYAARVVKLAGVDFDPSKDQQLSKVLYDRMGMKCSRVTKSGFRSVDEESLRAAEIETPHPIIDAIQEMRLCRKLRSTYVRGKKGKTILENTVGGRVYPQLRADGAASGRLSGCEPNMTNIPKRSSDLIRKGFIPDGPDWRLVSVDLSQVEPRLMGHYSGAKSFIDTFKAGRDVYRQMAVDCGLAETPEDVDTKTRREMKDFFLGLCYRMGIKAMATSMKLLTKKPKPFGKGGITWETYCKRLFDRFFMSVPEIKDIHRRSDNAVVKSGGSITLLGRRRRFAEKEAYVGFNHRIQGSAAELFKMGVVKAHEALKGRKTYILTLIHDDVLLMNHKSEWRCVLEVVDALTRFDDVIRLNVPLEANVTVYDTDPDGRWIGGREMTVIEILRAEMDLAEEKVTEAHRAAGLLDRSEEERLRISNEVAEKWPEHADSLVDLRLGVKQFWKVGESAAEFAGRLSSWAKAEEEFSGMVRNLAE